MLGADNWNRDDEPDPTFERVETTAKQLAKVDAGKYFPPQPFDLAKTFMQAWSSWLRQPM